MPSTKPITFNAPNVNVTDKTKWRYVTLPEFDLFDQPFQGASINGFEFRGGETYFMPPDYADELEMILRKAQKAEVRLIQSTPDRISIRQAYPDAHTVSE